MWKLERKCSFDCAEKRLSSVFSCWFDLQRVLCASEILIFWFFFVSTCFRRRWNEKNSCFFFENDFNKFILQQKQVCNPGQFLFFIIKSIVQVSSNSVCRCELLFFGKTIVECTCTHWMLLLSLPKLNKTILARAESMLITMNESSVTVTATVGRCETSFFFAQV